MAKVVVMAKKQHAWALLTPEAKSMLEQTMVAPSGDFVTVQDANGNDMQVPELHGGFALIGVLSGWDFVVGCGMDSVFAAMIQQLQAVGVQVGQPVGVLFAIVDDEPGTETPDYSMLDALMPGEAKASIDAWLVAQGYEVTPSGTYREVIEHVGGLCDIGYSVEMVTIS